MGTIRDLIIIFVPMLHGKNHWKHAKQRILVIFELKLREKRAQKIQILYELSISKVSGIDFAIEIIQTTKSGFRNFWTKFSENSYSDILRKLIVLLWKALIFTNWKRDMSVLSGSVILS